MAITITDIEDWEKDADEFVGLFELIDEGERFCVDLLDDGQSWYFVITPSSVQATVPHENRPEMEHDRLVVERTCRAISMMMGSHQYRKALEEEPEHE